MLALLRPVLGSKLRIVDRPYALRVHAKIYAFDGPRKSVLIGSFNPSGDQPELEPQVRDEIGDQDRAFNVLVETQDDALVEWLFAQTERLHTSWFARVGRFPLASPHSFAHEGEALWLLPRFEQSPLLERLSALPAGARVRLTATHVSGRIALRHLTALTARGVRVEALGESTERRVPRARSKRTFSGRSRVHTRRRNRARSDAREVRADRGGRDARSVVFPLRTRRIARSSGISRRSCARGSGAGFRARDLLGPH